jgi:hypothetical protein
LVEQNHFGSLARGHYIAYAKHKVDGKWYCFDDSVVKEIGQIDVKTPAAYVLLYARRGYDYSQVITATSSSSSSGTDDAGADDEPESSGCPMM